MKAEIRKDGTLYIIAENPEEAFALKYIFYLRNTITGETNTCVQDWEPEEDMLFQWLENNYACDCNRSLFLYDFDRDKQLECGDEIIVIDKIVRADGSCIDMDEREEGQ